METHISWVFLTADRALKVKKPVAFPFLDYRDPARRRELCEQEVRLNRRLAPDLYLGARGLAPDDGGWVLTDPGDPAAVEWAVEMRRFDERDTLAARVAAGTARPELVAAVGRLIANFHRNAERVPAGHGASIVASIEANFDSLAEAGAIGAGELRAARRFTTAFLATAGESLQRRAEAGLVRDGHGDLRAEHVVLGGRIEVFDCVEFDRRLREIDVGADLAFLVMDLVHAGRDDLAAELAAAYRASGGDPGDDALVSFFACYRAWVRAKVAVLRAGELAPGTPRASALDRARAFAATGRRLAWSARGPAVLVICGGAATGKTHLARRITAICGWRHLSSDVVRKRAIGVDPKRRAPARAYGAAMSERTYEQLGRLAAAELASGRGAIVDATFRFRRDRDAFARALGSRVPGPLFLECRAPAVERARRAAARERGHDRVSDAGPAQVERQLREFETLDEVPPADREVLRTDRPAALVVDEVERVLDSRLARSGPTLSRAGLVV